LENPSTANRSPYGGERSDLLLSRKPKANEALLTLRGFPDGGSPFQRTAAGMPDPQIPLRIVRV